MKYAFLGLLMYTLGFLTGTAGTTNLILEYQKENEALADMYTNLNALCQETFKDK